jgi:hypothetical protein
MTSIIYEVAEHVEGWGIRRGAEIAGSYRTREDALEAAKAFAQKHLGQGKHVAIRVPTRLDSQLTS